MDYDLMFSKIEDPKACSTYLYLFSCVSLFIFKLSFSGCGKPPKNGPLSRFRRLQKLDAAF